MSELDEIEEKYARMVGEVCPKCGAVLRVFKEYIKLKNGKKIEVDYLKCGNCGYREIE